MLFYTDKTYYDKPEKIEDYHRCRIEVVRTKRECRDLDRKWAKKRKEFEKKKLFNI
jgi:hypothetical protein